MTTKVITFTGSAADRVVAAQTLCRHLRIEPLASNTHRFNVGDSTVTIDGSGTGVIKQVAAGTGTSTVVLDAYDEVAGGGLKQVDAGEYWVIGTSGEKAIATYWQ